MSVEERSFLLLLLLLCLFFVLFMRADGVLQSCWGKLGRCVCLRAGLVGLGGSFCQVSREAHGFVTREEALRIHCCGQPFWKTLQRWQGLECWAWTLPVCCSWTPEPSWGPGNHSFASDRTCLSHSQQICVLAKSGEDGRMPLPLLMSSDCLHTSPEEQAALVPWADGDVYPPSEGLLVLCFHYSVRIPCCASEQRGQLSLPQPLLVVDMWH